MDWLLYLGLAGQLAQLQKGQEQIMGTMQQVLDGLAAMKTEVARLGPAVNALEAAITALKNAPSVATQEQVDQALALVQEITGNVTGAANDATDNVDEDAAGGGTTVPPVEEV